MSNTSANKIVNRYCSLIITVLLVSNTSCTKTVKIPSSEYESLKMNEARYLQVKRKDKRIYSVTKFCIADSVFYIKEIKKDPERFPYYDRFPIAISLDNIVSIEKVEDGDYLQTTGVVLGGIAILGVITYIVLLENLSD